MHATADELLEAVFYARSVPRMYNEDTRQFENLTLFLREINTRTWPSRLRESQKIETIKYAR
jgi:hypothetical protein